MAIEHKQPGPENMSNDQTLTSVAQLAMRQETDLALRDVAGQLAPRSRRIYQHDVSVFATWMIEQGLTPQLLEKSHMIAYRSYLQDTYAKSTAARMLSVARRLLAEQVDRKQLPFNPASGVRGFKGENETTHVALTDKEAQSLLDAIDISTLHGQRDYVLILLLLRTGIRRSEAAALTCADLTMREGHHVAIIAHGKGDQRRLVKIPVDVWREIELYLESLRQAHLLHNAHQLLEEQGPSEESLNQTELQHLLEQHTMSEHDGLFVQIRRGDHPTRAGISDRTIATIVETYAARLAIDGLSPHGLRASFITLTLESGASLHQVQYAAGHRDPRTTERYQKRKQNLDNNAVDKIHFIKRR